MISRSKNQALGRREQGRLISPAQEVLKRYIRDALLGSLRFFIGFLRLLIRQRQ